MVTHFLSRRLRILVRDEGGQTAFMMLLAMPVVFVFFALTVDAGTWFFDHRMAQNQADAAALAAVHFLPAADTTEATAAVHQWLTKNGASVDDLYCLEYSDLVPAGGDLQWDAVRVCVRRESPGIFSGISGVSFVNVSGAAGAREGAADGGNVKPWALAPEDPTCNTPGELCQADVDGDGDIEDNEHCGFYPPIPKLHSLAYLGLCPWGLHEDKLQKFKVTDKYTPGNFAPIKACGGGGAADYKDCITGETTSGFYSTGDSVWVDIETGNMVGPTVSGLVDLYVNEKTVSSLPVYKNKFEDTLECDVLSTPHPITGYDPVGKDAGEAAWINAPILGCDRRLISVVIIDHFPSGGGFAVVLGVATFGIARWDRTPLIGDAMGNSDFGQYCGQAHLVKEGGSGGYECGQVWGYFMADAQPPDMLVGMISTSDNPFAPRIMALTE